MTKEQFVYLDNNAAAPLRPEVKAIIAETMDFVGNPASVHTGGRQARAIMEDTRIAIADLINGQPDWVILTSSGTEANNLAIKGAAPFHEHIIVSGLEHPCVAQSSRTCGLELIEWPVGECGKADIDWLQDTLAKWPHKTPPLVTLMLAHNETGVIQPIKQVAEIVRNAGARLHVDAVQAAGKIEIDMDDLGVHSLAVAAHKLGGPIGIGALVMDPVNKLEPLLVGGGQERGLRAGGPNLVGIAGFGAACACAKRDLPHFKTLADMRDHFEGEICKLGPVQIMGQQSERLCNTSCCVTPGFAGQSQVMALDLEGVCVGSGSACSSGKPRPSAGLTAMGFGDVASNSIRVTSGWATTADDYEACLDAWGIAYERSQEVAHSA